jgi:hypothetical protein
MSGHIHTQLRRTLADCTVDWSLELHNPVDAYADFQARLGSAATRYEDYISTAITSGGYRRDTRLSYSDVVAKNSDYALILADELHHHGLIDVETTLDSVALGKVKGWKQSDYLFFFLTGMARPIIRQKYTPEYRQLLSIYCEPKTYDPAIFNDESLSNEARAAQYQAFTSEYWERTCQLDIAPIDRTIRVADWNRTLGGRAEEQLARLIGIRVFTPYIVATTHDFSGVTMPSDLRMHMQALTTLGADIVAPAEPPRLALVETVQQPAKT